MSESDVDGAIAVTGATGFIGSHLTRALVREGKRVIVVKRSSSNISRIADLLSKVMICDLDRVGEAGAFSFGAVFAVIHVATAYGQTGETPGRLEESNVAFPMRLLAAAAEHGVEMFISTDTFLTRAVVPVRGLETYASTKEEFRRQASAFVARRRLQFVTMQLEHVYGPDDGTEKFVPSLIHAFLSGLPTFALTPAEQLRDFIHVGDVVRAYQAVLRHHGELSDPVPVFEIGTGQTHTIRELVLMVKELTGTVTVPEFGARPYRESEVMASVADLTRIRELGWKPQVVLHKGLAATVAHERHALVARRRSAY